MPFKPSSASPEPSPEQIQQLMTLFAQNRLDELIEQATELTRAYPHAAQLHNILSVACNVHGDFHAAAEHAEKAIRIQPDYAKAYLNLGHALANLGDKAKAFDSYRQAVLMAPDFAEAHNIYGNYLIQLDRYEEAVPCFNKALEIKPDYASALSNLGCAQMALNRNEEAVDSLKRAIALDPDFAEAHNNMGCALLNLGRKKEAIASFEQAVALNPGHAKAHRNLAVLTHFSENDPHLAAMLELHRSPDISDTDRMYLGFAIFKAEEDLDHTDSAFEYLAEANRLKKSLSGYRIETDRRLFGKIRSAFSMNIPGQGIAADTNGITPLFIVGMPRSGTTLIEQILASHSQVYGAGEVTALDNAVISVNWNQYGVSPDQLQAVRDRYFEWLHQLDIDEPFVTDKTTTNFRWIGFILQAMPEARIIHTRRDARATCWSNFKQCFDNHTINFGDDLEDISEYYHLYVELMAFWEQRFPGRIHHIDYETLTKHQEEETRKLLQYCGLDWEDRCLEFHTSERAVATASSQQVRQKMYQGSSEAWRRYAAHLQPMLERLEGL